jgi:hypothetical protein
MSDETRDDLLNGVFLTVAVAGVTLVCLAGFFGFFAAKQTFDRMQNIWNAENEVRINEIRIHQQEQLIHVEQQKAQIRIVEATGIAEAQRLINATLTDKYLQHEAIKAQERMAGSPNHTAVYIPTGQNGIPIVKTVDQP